MIDYEKLKIAHKSIDKLGATCSFCYLSTYYEAGSSKSSRSIHCLFVEDKRGMVEEIEYANLDFLISKLKELTKSQPKFKVGDTVWYCDSENTIQECKIDKYCFVSDMYYVLDDCTYKFLTSENRLFPTKKDLIKAQLDYWHKQWGDICHKRGECDD